MRGPIDRVFPPDSSEFMVKVGFVSQRGPKKALFCRFLFSLHDFPWWSYAYDDHFPWWSKKCHFRPFFTNKIVSTHKSKVVGHQKLVNIGRSDQSFISGKVVLLTNNPAEESQVISFTITPFFEKVWFSSKRKKGI